jgi:hypothetical protein
MEGGKCPVPIGERVERFIQSKDRYPLIQKTNPFKTDIQMEKYVDVNTYMVKE